MGACINTPGCLINTAGSAGGAYSSMGLSSGSSTDHRDSSVRRLSRRCLNVRSLWRVAQCLTVLSHAAQWCNRSACVALRLVICQVGNMRLTVTRADSSLRAAWGATCTCFFSVPSAPSTDCESTTQSSLRSEVNWWRRMGTTFVDAHSLISMVKMAQTLRVKLLSVPGASRISAHTCRQMLPDDSHVVP